MTTQSKNHLSDHCYIMPHSYRSVMTTRQLKETLLATDNAVFACGRMYKIKNEKIGPGMYEVWLELKN